VPKAKSSFPPDEFDVVDPTAPRSPHRAPKTRAQRLVPFLVVIILGPLLAYVVVTAVSTGELPGRTPAAEATGGTVTPSVDPDLDDDLTESPDETPDSEDPEASETQTETEEPEPVDPDPATRVVILNSAGINGLAGRAQGILRDAGWTNVSTGNHSGDLPGSTVFYAEDDEVLLASAEAVAEELGIDRVELDPDEAGEAITVILESDLTT